MPRSDLLTTTLGQAAWFVEKTRIGGVGVTGLVEKVTGHCSSEVSRNRAGVSPRPSLVVEESGAANVSTRLGRLSRSTRASVLPGERVTGSRAAQRGGSGRRQAADALGGPRPPAVLSRRSGRRAYDLGGFFLFLR